MHFKLQTFKHMTRLGKFGGLFRSISTEKKNNISVRKGHPEYRKCLRTLGRHSAEPRWGITPSSLPIPT